MALRDQPYLPLYVQDYLTDEKLNMCTASTQGIYIKIMCIFHKSETYGGILLKQKDKQNENICLNFALKFAKLLPFDLREIKNAITELLDEKVLLIDGDFLYQKRMVKDNNISEKRSLSGSNGGKKTQSKNKKFAKAKSKAKSEYESESENEYFDDFELQQNATFEYFWNEYDKKVGDKEKIKAKFFKISAREQAEIFAHIPKYKESQPDKKYRKNPDTYLNNKSWNDKNYQPSRQTCFQPSGSSRTCRRNCRKEQKLC